MKAPSYSSRIILCPTCLGEGVRFTYNVTDYHRGEADAVTCQCRTCEGAGRLWERTTKTYDLVGPFSPADAGEGPADDDRGEQFNGTPETETPEKI